MIPSPYCRQRPESTWKPSAEAISSAASRDLPTPGSPTTVASWGCPEAASASALAQERELGLAAHHRRVEPAGARRCHRLDVREPVGGHGLRLALERERLDRLDRDRVAHEPEGRLPDQDLARGGGLLEAGGDVDRVAGHERLPGRALSGHDLAGVDPDAQRDPRAEALLELGVQRRQALLHLPGGAHGSQRIVLVRERDPEDRHHRVSDELLHSPAMALDAPRISWK